MVWQTLADPSTGYCYYWNSRTGESQWEKPLARLMGGLEVKMTSREAAPSTARPPVTGRDTGRGGAMTARTQAVSASAVVIQVRHGVVG